MLAWPFFHFSFFFFFSFFYFLLFGIKRVEGTNCGMAFWNYASLFLFIMNYGGDRLDLKKDGLFVTAQRPNCYYCSSVLQMLTMPTMPTMPEMSIPTDQVMVMPAQLDRPTPDRSPRPRVLHLQRANETARRDDDAQLSCLASLQTLLPVWSQVRLRNWGHDGGDAVP